MIDKLLNDAAGTLLDERPSAETARLIGDLRHERDKIEAQMIAFEAMPQITQLVREELAFLAARLDTVIPKLEATLERTRHPAPRSSDGHRIGAASTASKQPPSSD